MSSPVQHPSRHTWDFWYYFDSGQKLFHIFYLNADRALVASEQHHFTSCLGYATTQDFTTIDWGDEDGLNILRPPQDHWANTSIWSGDIVKIKTGYLLFYTSRDCNQDDGLTQSIGVAFASDLSSRQWHVLQTKIEPKFVYQTKSLAGDLSIHTWRDPFLFRLRDRGQIYMLVSAKLSKGAIGRNGAIALLKISAENFAAAVRGDCDWTYLPPISQPGCYPEMEVPQLYKNPQGGYELVFSSWAKHDFSPTTRGAGGLQGLTIPKIWNAQQNSTSAASSNPNIHVLMPEQEGLYACRIIPELDGEIVGFDIQRGGIRRSGVTTHLQSMDRDFSDLAI